MSAAEMEMLISNLEGDLGLPAGFFVSLEGDNDWSYIIKLHALFEGATAQMLEHKLGFPRLGSVLSRLEMSDKVTGKLAFARELELLGDGERRFLALLSEIRNHIVHNIRNVTFTLPGYVGGLDKNQRRKFLDAFAFVFADISAVEGKEVARDDFVRNNPKRAVHLASLGVLAGIYQQKELGRLRTSIANHLVERAWSAQG